MKSIQQSWLKVWTFYQKLKVSNNLTSHDILRQLNGPCTLANLEYLSTHCKDRCPAYKQGTIGRKLWDILLPGLKKTDWQAATKLTYYEKYKEMYCDGYFRKYDIDIIKEDDLHPLIDISVNHDKYYNSFGAVVIHDKNELARLLTIDEMVPEIRNISNSYWL